MTTNVAADLLRGASSESGACYTVVHTPHTTGTGVGVRDGVKGAFVASGAVSGGFVEVEAREARVSGLTGSATNVICGASSASCRSVV